VVREWSLATIYKGMFEFMILQVIAISLIIAFPQIATTFPQQLHAESRAIKVEDVDDSANRLEETYGTDAQQPGSAAEPAEKDSEETDSLEKDDLKAKK
jgi:hypothetical protein